MYCRNCGKEISDQAKFCNYCGMRIQDTQPQPAPDPQSEPVKKKGNAGKRVLSVLLAIAVCVGARMFVSDILSGPKQKTGFEAGLESTAAEDIDVKAAMSSCIYGALFQNGELTYGMIKLSLPGYYLYSEAGLSNDYLMSADDTALVGVNKVNELADTAFEESTREKMEASFPAGEGSFSMIDFRKYHVNNFPVIRTIAKYTEEGYSQYTGELIVFPGDPAKETIRVQVSRPEEYGYGEINRLFDSLQVSPDFRLKAEDTNVTGLTRITVKNGNSSALQNDAANANDGAYNAGAYNQGAAEIPVSEADIQAAMKACENGAIYENGTLRYGLVKLDIPGYTLYQREGFFADWLLSPDGKFEFYINSHLEEPKLSFDTCTEEDVDPFLRQHYDTEEFLDFQKYYVDGFPVIRYIVHRKASDEENINGELIIFPSETSEYTIRVRMYTEAKYISETEYFKKVFDTLRVSPDFRVTETKFDYLGELRITEK